MNSAEAFLTRSYRGEGPQSVLLYGAPGAGQLEAGRALAQFWLCKQPSEAGACLECAACRAFAGGRAVDFQEITPIGDGRQIIIDCIHEPRGRPSRFEGIPVLDFFRTRPLLAGSKVIMFNPADRINSSAANALLKILEEPPAHARLILVTNDLGSLLPTIRSRCACVACEQEIAPLDSDTAIFADTPEARRLLDDAPEAYAKLAGIFAGFDRVGQSGALRFAEDIRGAAEDLAKATGWPARSAHAEASRCLARWLIARRPHHPEAAILAAEAHRLIEANGSASLVFDQLLASILE